MTYQVLSCGSNGNYQLGQSHDEDLSQLKCSTFRLEDKSTTQVLQNRPVKIACGGNHTAILFEQGDLYMTGLNNKHQLFQNHDCGKEYLEVFQKVNFGNSPLKVKDVTAGWEFTVIATTTNELYVTGYGSNGELGKGNKLYDCSITGEFYSKLNIPNSSGIKKMKSSIHSTVIQFNDNELWCWGNNKKGQLIDINDNKKLKILWNPVKITEFEGFEVVDFNLGRDFSVFIVKTHDGILQSKFKGKDNFNIANELRKEKLTDSQKYLTMWSSFHLVETNNIKSIGNSSHGQLFPTTNIRLQKESVTTGSEHGLILTKENEVYAWGWGEHGNCGVQSAKGKSPDDVTFHYLNLLYEPSMSTRVVELFGGCATSWIITETTNTCLT